MKRFIALLAMLPFAADAQSTGNAVPSSPNIEMPVVQLPELLQLPQSRGCGGYRNANYWSRPIRTGTIYIVDDMVIETVDAVPIEPLKPLQDIDGTSTLRLYRNDIATLPYTDLTDMVSLFPSVHQLQRGAANHVGGSRQEDILYVIDGMQVARR